MSETEIESRFQVYCTCRYRDACLRMMNIHPVRWIEANVTPCPCTHEHFKRVMQYVNFLYYEKHGVIPYGSRFVLQEKVKIHRPQKNREVPVTQKRLVL